jgi:hypothetical protein
MKLSLFAFAAANARRAASASAARASASAFACLMLSAAHLKFARLVRIRRCSLSKPCAPSCDHPQCTPWIGYARNRYHEFFGNFRLDIGEVLAAA